MSPILDLLNRMFLADPTRALEIVTQMFEQHTRDVRFWRDKYERANQELSTAQYDAEGWETFAKTFEAERDAEFLASKDLREDYARLLDQKHALEAEVKEAQHLFECEHIANERDRDDLVRNSQYIQELRDHNEFLEKQVAVLNSAGVELTRKLRELSN